jgi:alpha-tubulin suppressor-like RCC1 family protein
METFQLIFQTDKVNCKNIILIDNNVPEFMTFYNACNDNTYPIVYSTDSSRDSILGVLNKFDTIERLSLCFVNNYNNKFLNNQFMIDNDNTDFIISLIQKYDIKNIDYLGCELLNQENWKNYFEYIKNNANVIVGASNDKTGNLKYGGDWIMESTSEDIQNIYFNSSILNYSYLLDFGDLNLVINSSGILFGTGYGGFGGLGLSTDTGVKNLYTQITQVSGSTGFYSKKIKKTSNGVYSTHAITTDSLLYCSGMNDKGQLGVGTTADTRNIFTQAIFTSGGSNLSNILIAGVECGGSTSSNFTIALDLNGKIYGTGSNSSGQFGNGTTTDQSTFSLNTNTIVNNLIIKQIACGGSHTMIITYDGKLYGSGYNSYGQLGLGNTTNVNVFTQAYLPNSAIPVQVACGANFTYVVDTYGNLYTTGVNNYGQLGLGDTTNRSSFVLVSTFPGNATLKFACGDNHGIIVTTNNNLYATGINDKGQLGLASNYSQTTSFINITTNGSSFPVGVGYIANVFCNMYSSHLLTYTGYLYGTGRNNWGQLAVNSNYTANFGFIQALTTGAVAITGLIDQYSDIISNICFVAGSIVSTDQGLKPIEKIDPSIQTINGKPILHVTQTYTIDEHLVCINKNALGKNIPNKKTIVSKNHLIMFNKKLMAASDLVYLANGVEFVENTGELLYNILLERRTLMNVNNIMTETLDPKNIVAKSYLGHMSEEEKTVLYNNNYEHLSKLKNRIRK